MTPVGYEDILFEENISWKDFPEYLLASKTFIGIAGCFDMAITDTERYIKSGVVSCYYVLIMVHHGIVWSDGCMLNDDLFCG